MQLELQLEVSKAKIMTSFKTYDNFILKPTLYRKFFIAVGIDNHNKDFEMLVKKFQNRYIVIKNYNRMSETEPVL